MPRNGVPYAGKPGVKRKIVDGQLNCLDCGPRPLTEFRPITRKQNGRPYFESRCDACRCARYIARNFNISPETYRRIIKAADGKCAICGNSAPKLVLDHCHTSGRIRGALCALCNSGLAVIENMPEFIPLAFEYLHRWQRIPMTPQDEAEAMERLSRFERIHGVRKAA